MNGSWDFIFSNGIKLHITVAVSWSVPEMASHWSQGPFIKVQIDCVDVSHQSLFCPLHGLTKIRNGTFQTIQFVQNIGSLAVNGCLDLDDFSRMMKFDIFPDLPQSQSCLWAQATVSLFPSSTSLEPRLHLGIGKNVAFLNNFENFHTGFETFFKGNETFFKNQSMFLRLFSKKLRLFSKIRPLRKFMEKGLTTIFSQGN
jgi:hypothetical protein